MSAADVEALAEELWGCSAGPGAAPTDAHREMARAVLASDWLAADRARVRAETLTEVQVEFERMGPIWGATAAWLTTGNNVAALAVDVVRGMAEAGEDQ